METADRVQLHLILPSRQEAREHPRIREHLGHGWRIVQLQRISDREVVVTLARPTAGGGPSPAVTPA